MERFCNVLGRRHRHHQKWKRYPCEVVTNLLTRLETTRPRWRKASSVSRRFQFSKVRHVVMTLFTLDLFHFKEDYNKIISKKKKERKKERKTTITFCCCYYFPFSSEERGCYSPWLRALFQNGRCGPHNLPTRDISIAYRWLFCF